MTHFNHSPTTINCTDIRHISKHLHDSKKHLKDIKGDASNHREEHPKQLANEGFIFENIKHEKYLRNLITIKQQVALHRKIQSL